MGTFVIAYLLGWAATSAFAGWLAVENSRLAARQRELQRLLNEAGGADALHSRAA